MKVKTVTGDVANNGRVYMKWYRGKGVQNSGLIEVSVVEEMKSIICCVYVLSAETKRCMEQL